MNTIRKLAHISSNKHMSSRNVIDPQGISPCLCSAMGLVGAYPKNPGNQANPMKRKLLINGYRGGKHDDSPALPTEVRSQQSRPATEQLRHHQRIQLQRNHGNPKAMKRFLAYTRDSKGKCTARHIRATSNTVHCSSGTMSSMASYIITIRHEANPTQETH